MRKLYLSILALMLCTMLQAISWTKPQFTTTTNPTTGGSTLYYLYHVGQERFLTAGASWGTHAILDSTGVNALPYEILYYYQIGYQFHSPNAESQGYLFRESSGTDVFTDYNGHSNSSIRWDIIQNGNGTVGLRTASNDPVWGSGGSMVTYGQDQYLLGWTPLGMDKDKNGQALGTNQSVYMLYPGIENYQYEWAFVAENEYNLYNAKLELYTTAEQAEKKGINYKTYSTAYNGSDIDAVKTATAALKAKIEESAQEEKEEENEIGDAIFFALNDGSTMIFPKKYIEDRQEKNGLIVFSLKGDTTVTIAKSHILSETTEYKGKLPNFESFKFNNKFNDQLFTDAEGVIDSVNHKVSVTVGCIGKRLTPSFKVPDEVRVYIKGERQYSKESRPRFDKPVHYTLAYPKQYVYNVKKVKGEVWSDPENSGDQWISTPLTLTSDMFSTNAPSNQANEGPASMLDGNHNTIFHSTWGSGTYTPLSWYDGAYYGDGISEWPYLQVELPEPLYQLKFEYTTRSGNNNYAPLSFILQGSNNGTSWSEVKTFTADADDLPTTPDATYTSEVVNLGNNYKYLRWQLTSAQRKNYLVFSEFALYKVEENPNYTVGEPILISPAEYKKTFVPYGTDYEVTVDFLTDHETSSVPRIDIWFGDSISWNENMWIGRYGKTTYEDAQIKIDGGGVYPDMEKTQVQIKGRGNSTWAQYYESKNPYRLKFTEKQKPFGLTKGKSWVLLCNKQTGSMTTNAIAMKVADMVETRGCNHIVPVELYINNQYRGSYNFTEKVGFSNNSIDIAKENEPNATMIELDTNTDETIYKEENYGIKTKIKEPDLEDATTETNLTSSQIMDAFNALTYDVKYNCENAQFDVESVVRAMFVTDLVRNEELMHAKSWFIYNEDITADSLWNLGPVWDFDWSFGYERGGKYFITAADVDLFRYMGSNNIGYPFFYDLLRGSEKVKKEYYRLWTKYMNNGSLEELIEYCDDYFQYARPSLEHNYTQYFRNGEFYSNVRDGADYDTHTTNAKNWLRKRANYIYSHLDVYDLSDDIIDPEDDYGQPDRIDIAKEASRTVNVYNINGMIVRRQVPYGKFADGLQPGIYIVNGKKIAVGR